MSTDQQSGRFVASLRISAVLSAVGCARAFVRQTLHAWELLTIIDTAVLITSELMTNAVLVTGNSGPHTGSPALDVASVIHVRLSIRQSVLIIEVWDVSTDPPILQLQDSGSLNGRGLNIVHLESDLWGTYFPKVGGKVVWAEVTMPRGDTQAEAMTSLPEQPIWPEFATVLLAAEV